MTPDSGGHDGDVSDPPVVGGTVVDEESGEPLSGLIVEVRTGRPSPDGAGQRRPLDRVETDEAGRFSVAATGAGNAEAVSIDVLDGDQFVGRTVVENPGDATDLTVPVDPAGRSLKGLIAAAVGAVGALAGGAIAYDELFGGSGSDGGGTQDDAGSDESSSEGDQSSDDDTDDTSDGGVPAVPANVVASAGSDAITVTWDPVDGASTYTLYWDTSEDVSPETGTAQSDVSSPFTHDDVDAGATYYYVVTAINDAGESPASDVAQATVETTELTVPEPDTTTQTTVDETARVLYEGEDAVQSGVEEGAIEDDRVSVVRGTVTSRGGDALANVTVSTPENPDLGTTKTRSDGRFDMAINGGTHVVLRFERSGYLPVQRKFGLGPNAQRRAPPVALVREDEQSTTVEMDTDEGQIHRASTVSDGDGDRQATVYVPPGTAASRSDDGTAPTSLELRATEYTVGEDGPDAMPAELPSSVGYTYAPELRGRDASGGSSGDSWSGFGSGPFVERDGEGDVEFDQPVVEYEYNFLDFPVGTPVPVGFYDDEQANWKPSDDGRVIEILDVDGGSATLDVDGSGEAATDAQRQDLGITDDELATLADNYEAGDQLWRTPVPHFTPWDCNWSSFPPEDSVPPLPEIPEIERVIDETPPEPPSTPKGEKAEEKDDDPCED